MPKTTTRRPVQTTESPTRRERRIQEQRARIEVMRAQERRKRMVWFGGILVGLLAVVAALWLLIPRGEAQGRQVSTLGDNGHVPVGTPVQYPSRPPAAGPHYAETTGYGFFEREIEPGYWVHNLEHGAIVVLYHPYRCDEACRATLRDQVYARAPLSRFRNVKMSVIPYREMDSPIAVVAWGWIDEMETVNPERIIAFYRAHVDRGPEQVP